jgi:lipopolysaccharide biosynthesis glycosyltransferase
MSAGGRTDGAVAVACAADAAYVMPLAAMLHSAVAHLAPSRRMVVHVLAEGIGAPDRKRLAGACARAGVSLSWIDADPAALDDLPTWGRMPRTTYQRLLLPDLLPDLGMVIWLD